MNMVFVSIYSDLLNFLPQHFCGFQHAVSEYFVLDLPLLHFLSNCKWLCVFLISLSIYSLLVFKIDLFLYVDLAAYDLANSRRFSFFMIFFFSLLN